MQENRKVIFSFDDEPAPIDALHTILGVLLRNAIKAEFYVLGSELEKFPNEARFIVNQGHILQNHSWSHANLAKASKDRVRSELEKTQKIIHEVTGSKATKVRPPYGAGGWPSNYDPELASVARRIILGNPQLGYRY